MKPLSFRQEDTIVVQKIKELCQTILDQPVYKEMRQTIETFLADVETRAQYQHLCDLQEALHQKHQSGVEITEVEMQDFENHETAFLNNPIAQGFIEAQRSMQKIEATVNAYVRRMFELGRMPTSDEVSVGGCACGSGSCGCH
ncbi:MAG: YlbF family regulator [Kiritimatiellae bacterium]|nr:YlbF family regulator [Kiritimatiellia bacterium]